MEYASGVVSGESSADPPLTAADILKQLRSTYEARQKTKTDTTTTRDQATAAPTVDDASKVVRLDSKDQASSKVDATTHAAAETGESHNPTANAPRESSKQESVNQESVEPESLKSQPVKQQIDEQEQQKTVTPKLRESSPTMPLSPQDLPFVQRLSLGSDHQAGKSQPTRSQADVSEPQSGITIRRAKNVRPVDIAKSAGDESNSFVPTEHNLRESAATQPIDEFMASEMRSAGEPPNQSETVDQRGIDSSVANNSGTKPNEPGCEVSKPAVGHSGSTGAPSGSAVEASESTRPDAPTMPIPDQIKNLSDSISNFAKPVVPKRREPESDF